MVNWKHISELCNWDWKTSIRTRDSCSMFDRFAYKHILSRAKGEEKRTQHFTHLFLNRMIWARREVVVHMHLLFHLYFLCKKKRCKWYNITDNSHYVSILKPGKEMQINHHRVRKNILKLVQLQCLVAKCCKIHTHCLSSKPKWFRISLTIQDHRSFGVSLAQITKQRNINNIQQEQFSNWAKRCNFTSILRL
jgi:hypothetical protein